MCLNSTSFSVFILSIMTKESNEIWTSCFFYFDERFFKTMKVTSYVKWIFFLAISARDVYTPLDVYGPIKAMAIKQNFSWDFHEHVCILHYQAH